MPINGNKIRLPNTKWISCVDITPWQRDRLKEVCVAISDPNPSNNRLIYAVEVNEQDMAEIQEVVIKEGIVCFRR